MGDEADLQRFLASFSAQSAVAAEPATSIRMELAGGSLNVSISKGDGPSAQMPQCVPITKMASDFTKTSSGRLLAVNENYICYTIKGNAIRVIHFVNVSRNKLPPHAHPLCDMEFSKASTGSSDLLASLDVSGTLLIRRIFEPSEGGECQFETELEENLPCTVAQRVFWGPVGTVLVSCDNAITLIRTRDTPGDGSFPRIQCVARHDAAKTIQDSCFNADFSLLLTAGDDGDVRIWDSRAVGVAASDGLLNCVSVLSTGSSQLSSALFVGLPNHHGFQPILLGASGNAELSLWAPGTDDAHSWTKAQDVQLNGGGGWVNIVASAENVVVADMTQEQLCILHLSQDTRSAASFDLATKWTLEHPILSFVARETSEVERGLQVFALQTKSVSKYTIRGADCSPIFVAPTSPAQSAPVFDVAPPRSPSTQAGGGAAIATPILAQTAAPPASAAPPAPPAAPLSPPPVAQPTIDLQALENRLLAGFAARLDAQQRALVNDIDAKLSAKLDSKLNAKFDALSHKISQELAATASAVSSAVTSQIKASFSELRTELKAAAREDSKHLEDRILATVSADIKDHCITAFRSSFEELLIPSVETATQRMFTQIDEALSARVISTPLSSPPALPPKVYVEPKVELEGLLGEQKYEEALVKTLGAQNLELLSWLLKKINPSIMHELQKLQQPLSQTVLLCMLQQLGSDLESDTATKLDWLKEIALTLDTESTEIVEYAPRVIAEVKKNTREFQATEAGQLVRTELSLILRVL